MKAPFRSTSGIAYPDDLKRLNEVFRRICRCHGIQEGSPEAERVSLVAMSLFSSGLFDESHLVAELNEFMKRQKGHQASQRPVIGNAVDTPSDQRVGI